MHSLRKWLYRPKRTDTSLLAQFYYADDELNTVAEELDSFDGRKDPDRCTTLVNQLRTCQNRVLNICNRMMDEVIGDDRAPRDFRVKFPDDVLQENLAGQLWFGAECLAAGSCIMNRESESAGMRPLAKAVTKSLDSVRVHLREQCLKAPQDYTEQLCETLKIFDRLFAEFELRYVSAMVPVKSTKEYSLIQDVVTLFSETVQRALRLGLLCQEQLDLYDPALMFTIPRLAIVAGLVVFPDGPLRLDRDITLISELFRPFKNLLCKIRELLWALSKPELFRLERCLCSVDEPTDQLPDDDQQLQLQEVPADAYPPLDIETFIAQFYALNPGCRRSVSRSAWRETEARLRQTQHRRGRGPPPPPRRRGARSGAPPPVPVPQSAGSAVVDSPVTAPRLHRVRSIPCDYGSRVEQRRELESDMRALLTSLVDSAVLSSEQHRHSTPATTLTTASTAAPSTVEPSDPAESVVDPQRHCQSVQQGSRQSRRRGLHSGGGTGSAGCCTQSPLDAVQFTQPRVCENGVTTAVTSSSSESEDEPHDSDREIALAIQAAEAATRNRARARFKDSQDLTHRLFVCISGVADQLQTNFASDLRHILKVVFQINATPEHDSNGDVTPSCVSIDSAEDALSQSADDSPPGTPSGTETRPSASVVPPAVHPSHLASNMRVVGDHMEAEVLVHGSIGITAQSELVQRVLSSSAGDATGPSPSPAAPPVTVPARLAAALEPPPPARPAAPPDWVPDRLASECMLCCAVFTVVRRRHHCRRCGGVFCRRCSSGALPLLQYGYTTAVRVCDTCLSAQQC